MNVSGIFSAIHTSVLTTVLAATSVCAISLPQIESASYDLLSPALLGTLRLLDSSASPNDLLFCLQTIRSEECDRTSLSASVAAAIVFIRLGDGGSISYYDSAAMQVAAAQKKFGRTVETQWIRALIDLRTHRLAEGISLFDSLNSMNAGGEALLKDYAAAVFAALVPKRGGAGLDSFSDFLADAADSSAPTLQSFRVERMQDGSGVQSLPTFSFGASFAIHAPAAVGFKGLGFGKTRMRVQDSGLSHFGLLPENYVLLDRRDTATCRLFIDVNDTKRTAQEYLSRRVDWRFDSVAVSHNEMHIQGVSLRGYVWPRFQNGGGRFTAVATFDIPVKPGRVWKKAGGREDIQRIRYTLVVQASTDSQAYAEARFRAMLKTLLSQPS